MTQPTNTISTTTQPDYISRRVDEFATEVQGWRAQAGEDVAFGFDTGRASAHFLEADEQIGAARRLLDHKAVAFGMQAPEAQLLKRVAEYPFKSLIPLLLAVQVSGLIERDGRQDEFRSLLMNSRTAHTADLREKALQELHRRSKPYYAQAQTIIQGHVEVYNPHSDRSPLHRENFG